MKIYCFGDTAVCLEMDTQTKKMRFLSFDEMEKVEERNNSKRQHILRLLDRDITMIGQAYMNSGYTLGGIE